MSQRLWSVMMVLLAVSFGGLACLLSAPRHTAEGFEAQARACLPAGTPRADAERWLRRQGVRVVESVTPDGQNEAVRGAVHAYTLRWPPSVINVCVKIDSKGNVAEVGAWSVSG